MAGYETRAFRGLGVFVSMPFEVSDDQDSVQMLQRSSQVGEFYRMMPPPVWNKGKALPGQYMVRRCRSRCRETPPLPGRSPCPRCVLQDLLIYDEEMDQLKHISFEQALWATGATDGGALDVATLVGPNFVNQLPQGEVRDKDGNVVADGTAGGGPGAVDPLGDMVQNNNVTIANIMACVQLGVWMPICITIVRPFIEHLMMSTVCTVSGRDTGATLFGSAARPVPASVPLGLPHTRPVPAERAVASVRRAGRRTCRFRPTRR